MDCSPFSPNVKATNSFETKLFSSL